MARAKKWSTGSIGNPYPDHSERSNPNTRGLSVEGVPGVEGYIEEDRVLASEDNRPIENLAQNDQILEQNLASIASEVDYGVLKDKDNEFQIEVLQKGDYTNPDDEDDTISITPLRINSGQAIVDGQVTSIGSQKIIYFLKDDGSYIFPDYVEHEGKTVIPISDDQYTGTYKPVYDAETDGLPESFENYEIKITNKNDGQDDKNTYFKVYRDWEDIIPYAPYEEEAEADLNFIYDENYGRESEGVWLKDGSGGDGDIDNIKISEVVVTKDIEVKDKKLDDFIPVGSNYEQYIVTDGIFFDNVPWKTETQEEKEVQDIYVNDNNDIYFVYKHEDPSENLFYLPALSTQVSNIILSNTIDQAVTKLIESNGLLYILGTNGYFRTYDLLNTSAGVVEYDFFANSGENFNSVVCWEDEIWIATDANIYHVPCSSIAPDMTLEMISFADELDVVADTTDLVEKINILKSVHGNFFVDSSLKSDIHNLIKNPSFEKGGIDELPTFWNSTDLKVSPSDTKYGNYKAILGTAEASQTLTVEDGKEYTFSVYLKSIVDTNVEIFLGTEMQTVSIMAGAEWERFSITAIVSGTEVNVGVVNATANMVQLDAAQFELGELNQFVDGFEYLFIGFEKNKDDAHSPPFAIIDSKRKDQINYSVGTYGNIKSVNDVTQKCNNELVFIDDTDIYSLVILNDEDEYDRITINNLTDNNSELNLDTKIDRLNTVKIFNNRIFFGGTILNKSISFSLVDTEDEHVIEILSVDDADVKAKLDTGIPRYYDITDILGTSKLIPSHGDVGVTVEFSRTEELYELRTSTIEPGYYKAGGIYTLAFRIDEDIHIINISMPALYEGPVSIEKVYDLINEEIYVLINEGTLPSSLIDLKLEYSNSRVDGLYSIGKNKITRHIRGNIENIFIQDNIDEQSHYNKGIYIILEDAILRSKYDTNIKKTDGVYIEEPVAKAIVDNITELPATAEFGDVYHVEDFGYYKWDGSTWVNTLYLHPWTLDETNHSVREFKNKYNQEVIFTAEAINKPWIDLPISPDYKLVPGSLRVKTNSETEIGYSENADYFVDYNNGRIVRSSLENKLKDSNFEFVDTSSDWQKYMSESVGNVFNFKKKLDYYISTDGEEKILDSYATAYVETPNTLDAAVYQYMKPSSLEIGDTYTFSIKLKTNQYKTGDIKISECVSNSNTFDVVNDSSSLAYLIDGGEEYDENATGDVFNEWREYNISHTITDDTSQYVRVEVGFRVSTQEQLFMKESQLERNQVVTPYVKEYTSSRIDAGSTVFVDFTETRDLVDGADYSFDTEERRVIYYGDLTEDTELYFDYKYKKVFNPKIFETSIPKFDISYDEKDDYFLYLYSGRIWAINFVLALLSQDEENPLVIDYKYHYPRVDKIKIRNSPDLYGNYAYIVKGTPDDINPYGPYDKGTDRQTHVVEVSRDKIEDTESNEMIYEINVFDDNYSNNDIYDRRVFVESADHKYFNISLYEQTVGYFPYSKDFMSTAGMNPINRLYNSKIVDIIKNFDITQLEEIGAWGSDYQLTLRSKIEYPGTAVALFVDIDFGDDTNTGELFTPLRTITEALRRIKDGEVDFTSIIVKSEGLITEDIEVDIPVSEIRIYAQTYARWQGNIQNKTPLILQGFQFERHNTYVVETIKFYYCTFINSTVNNYIPTEILFSNCKIEGGNNKFLYVKNTIFPSPFLHPYMKNESADDGTDGSPLSVATSNPESIHPNVASYQEKITGNPSGSYSFFRCLITGLNDDIINYNLKEDGNEDWISDFVFTRCTIVDNNNLFVTNKSSQLVQYDECIIYENGEQRGSEFKYFDSQSNINFQNSYIDLDTFVDGSELNFNQDGLVFGRETCVAGLETEPGFVSTQEGFEDYRLRSEAQGFLSNSVCIGRAVDGRDVGCYDELRERLDVEVPKKLKSNFAFIGEGIHYPIILNSEKITFTLEFKPSNSFSQPAVLFDTRSHIDDKDFIAVVYNNNSYDNITNIEPDEDTAVTDPYTFKIIVANEKMRYVVVSPISMYSDADYQVWNQLSFTVNYEKTFNEKAAFDEKDKYQNIITMFHNEELAVESFLKNDLSYNKHNEILEGSNNDDTNDWNYNNISKFITIGSTFDQQYILNGYYSELRIDNKYINRKELEAWNKKIVPFNDPITYLDQNNLARTFDSSTVNDLWTLKTKYDIGAKGHNFNEHTNKRFTFDEGEFTWVLTTPTTNYIEGSDLSQPMFAQVITDVPPSNDTENQFPVVFDHTMTIKAIGGNTFDTTTGIFIDFTDGGTQFYSHNEIYDFFRNIFDDPTNAATKMDIRQLPDNRFQIITQDYAATSIEVWFWNGGDAEEFGFSTLTGQGNGYYVIESPNSSKTIVGNKNTDAFEITAGLIQSLKDEHFVEIVYDEEHTNLSSSSLHVTRTITGNNNDDQSNDILGYDKYIRIITHRKGADGELGMYDATADEPYEYTYSLYLYRRDNEFAIGDVQVTVGDTEFEFDSVENIHGYWWLAQKTLRFETPNPVVGIIVKGEIDFYIDAVQLEQATFASPYVIDSNPEDGMIELDKALFTDARGVVFFRFKPLFRYNTSEKHVLFEALAGKDETDDEGNITEVADEQKGFKVWYEFDEELQKGKLQFRTGIIEPDGTTPDEAAWETIVLEQFWDNWHTIVISYDFDTKRFIYFFDYFKNTADVSITPYKFFTNASIGKDAIIGITDEGAPIFPFGSHSAEIMVKDVVITNYTTSDNELKNWVNSNEFYKETLFNSLLDSYQHEMYNSIASIEGLTHDTFNIEQDIASLNSKISTIEGLVDSDVDLTLIKVRQDELRNSVYHETSGILTTLDILDDVRVDHNDRIASNRSSIITNAAQIQENTDNIAQEVSARQVAITALISRLASTNLGDGASIIGINDPDNKFGATNVESVLLEIEASVQANADDIGTIQTDVSDIQTDMVLMQGTGWTAASAVNDGFNISSLRVDTNQQRIDIDSISDDLTQEITDRADADIALDTALRLYISGEIDDLAGVGRTVETIKSNWDLIQLNIQSIGHLLTMSTASDIEINLVKDGLDGTTWDSTMNLQAHDVRLDGLEGRVAVNESGIADNVSDISALDTRTGVLETSLAQEIIDRTNADTSIRSDLMSVATGLSGASQIGISDDSSSYTSLTVEGALQEVDSKLQALAGSLQWQPSVANVAALPTTDNLNDSRIVEDDGDGKRAQYVYNGTDWVKVSDVDWGDANAIAYDNADAGLIATDVKGAIDELYVRSASPNNSEEDVIPTMWIADGDDFYYDVNHGLDTMNIAIRAVDSSGQEFGVDEYERIDANTVRVKVASAIDATFTVFGAHNSYSKVIGTWSPVGGMYVKDVVHTFNTQQIMISIFNIMTGERVGVDSIETLDDNAIRVMTSDNSDVLNVFVLNKTSNATTKDIDYWVANTGMYESILPLALDYDAVYSFYDPATSRTVEVDSVGFENGMLKIRRTENTPLRMVVLK